MSMHQRSLHVSRFSRRSLLVGGGAAALLFAAPRASLARYPTPRLYLHQEWLIDATTLMKHHGDVRIIARLGGARPAHIEAAARS